jgi:hypothetical protein
VAVRNGRSYAAGHCPTAGVVNDLPA